MRFEDIKARAVVQATGDIEEAEAQEPWLGQYVNEGYDRLAAAFGKAHPVPMTLADDVPDLPEWAHGALADYTCWMLMRNGNAQRQSRGLQFRAAFEEARARALGEGSKQFTGVYP